MIRKSVRIDSSQNTLLKKEAKDLGTTESAIISEALDMYFGMQVGDLKVVEDYILQRGFFRNGQRFKIRSLNDTINKKDYETLGEYNHTVESMLSSIWSFQDGCFISNIPDVEKSRLYFCIIERVG